MADIFGYFESVKDWGEWNNAIFETLIEVSNIEGLPDNFSIDYIKYKEGVGIRVEYENAGQVKSQIDAILLKIEHPRLENR